MSKIILKDLRHSYLDNPVNDDDWALKSVNIEWADGGAYAILGPSGCGKTTLLNIISGLLTPTQGRVLFGDEDVTDKAPDERNIAQVFQFPVVYDTLSVYDNLAFPLRNRAVPEQEVDKIVRETAEMLDLLNILDNRASNLSADGKQKISLGRGIVRSDVNVIMFDEPLTVIDPHLKWQLRTKLKELHRRIKRTMLYVTHDQTEALTFADQVMVMQGGEVVQVGTPRELFERPKHTFVGHFIGSPGMNVLPVDIDNGKIFFNGIEIKSDNKPDKFPDGAKLEIGVRPEFIHFADEGIPVDLVKVVDTGRDQIVETRAGDLKIKLLIGEGQAVPSDNLKLGFDPAFTQVYADGWEVS